MAVRMLMAMVLVLGAAMPAAPAEPGDPSPCAVHSPHTGEHEQASCGLTKLGAVEVSTTAGLGQVEVRDGLAAVGQRDDGQVALVDARDPAAPAVLGRYNPNTGNPDVDQPCDGDVA